jgi:hypothetical protein
LSCGVSCCASIGHFGADTVPDFLIREELITGFTQSATSASIAAAFDAPSQMAAVAFAFDQAYDIDPYYVMVSVDAAGDDVIPASDITVSLESGDAGCQYPIAYSSGTSAYLDVYPTCWNGFTTTSPVSQINVRLTSFAAGNAEMTVYGLAF